MKGYTVQVNNVSPRASIRDLRNFFSFLGRIAHIEVSPRDGHDNRSQVALVTFKDKESLETALLLSGSTIVDQAVSIVSLQHDVDQEVGWAEEELHGHDSRVDASGNPSPISPVVITRAQDIVANMLSKGHILTRDAVSRAKSFDERRQLNANMAMASPGDLASKLDKSGSTIGLSGRLNAGASIINMTAQSINERFHIAERTWSVYSYAQQGAKCAGTTLVNNKMVQSGSSWVSGAFYKVAQAAGNVTLYGVKDKLNSSELPKVSRARV